MKKLHEPNASFNQPARQQAVIRKRDFTRLGAILSMDVGGLGGNIHGLGNGHLHPKRQFILSNARQNLWVLRFLVLLLVDFGDGIDTCLSHVAGNAIGV